MYTAGFDTTDNSPEVLGGKGRSLSHLAAAGFDVPDGFVVTTSAYRDFVEAKDLQARLLALSKPEIVEGVVSFEKAAERIRRLFERTKRWGTVRRWPCVLRPPPKIRRRFRSRDSMKPISTSRARTRWAPPQRTAVRPCGLLGRCAIGTKGAWNKIPPRWRSWSRPWWRRKCPASSLPPIRPPANARR